MSLWIHYCYFCNKETDNQWWCEDCNETRDRHTFDFDLVPARTSPLDPSPFLVDPDLVMDEGL